MLLLFDLQGRIVVITGGLGKLGRQFAAGCCDPRWAGAAVLDLRATGDRTLGGAVPENLFTRVMSIAADVTNRGSLEAALVQIEMRWGTPFGLVNNAALDCAADAPANENGPYEDFPAVMFDHVMAVNVEGAHLCCQPTNWAEVLLQSPASRRGWSPPYHLSGSHLLRFAQEAAWCEDKHSVPNGEQVQRVC
jgi:NAD(P)-dependent dehydrogenase (short-subunit alcohol dehydrogenase family)